MADPPRAGNWHSPKQQVPGHAGIASFLNFVRRNGSTALGRGQG
jgi:hypothetical protein